MHLNDRQEKLASWLDREGIAYTVSDGREWLETGMSGTAGRWECGVRCDGEPALLHVLCRLPLRVPESRLEATAQLLYRLNSRLRLGAFCLHAELRSVTYRVTLPCQDTEELARNFALAWRAAEETFNAALQPLCRFICDTPEARGWLAPCLGNTAGGAPKPEATEGRRPSWN